ncbi:MAG: HAD hydrolase family protein, partial [Anaeroplasmataceae bacterium]|nr:HAD hydrolase family protein [Anaeroplasmataceae bacterium]
KMLYNNQSFCPKLLDKEKMNHLLNKIPVLTAYTILNETEIISYQTRLKLFYPNTFLKLIHKLDHDVSFLILAIEKKYYHELKKELTFYFIQIIGEDTNKYILKITASPSTKEDWIKRVKKSPALGIGDSLQDYSFLKHCDYSVAMLNADARLKELCTYTTSKDNNHNGAVDFILHFLKHQPS